MSGARDKALKVMQKVLARPCLCPAHGNGGSAAGFKPKSFSRGMQASGPKSVDYAVDIHMTALRFGEGVTQEVGHDIAGYGAKSVCVVTDRTVQKLPGFQTVLDSLTEQNLNIVLYDDVQVEPKESDYEKAIKFTRENKCDSFVAFGGGSVMDTAKACNLFVNNPDSGLRDFIIAPIGKALPIPNTNLAPIICIPTTSGTASENTGVSVIGIGDPWNIKIGLAARALRPTLGLIDPVHALSMPTTLATYCGLDTLCHSLESFTTLPFQERGPRPSKPSLRPIYQGRSDMSDVWALYSLKMCADNLVTSAKQPDNFQARKNMHYCTSAAGLGMASAGVHLPHAMSYPLAASGKAWKPNNGYANEEKPLIPHGLAVVLTSPSVYEFTADADAARHLQAAELLGVDVTNAKRSDAGRILAEALRKICHDLNVEDGLKAVGLKREDIPAMVDQMATQSRTRMLAPKSQTDEELYKIYENSLTMYH